MRMRPLRTLLPLALAAASIACSAPASEEPADADEGALLNMSDDEVVESIVGEVSRGPSLGANFDAKPADEKQKAAWDRLSSPGELRCGLGGSISGEALVAALRRCPAGDAGLRTPTLLGSLGRADYQVMMSILSHSKLLSPAFDHTGGDELPVGRKKLFHPFGSTAKIELRIDPGTPYTGVLSAPAPGFSESRVRGLARISSGGAEAMIGFVPGMGIKLFTDQGASVDLHVMNGMRPQESRDGAPSYNVFERPFSNEFLTDGTGISGAAIRAGVELLGFVQPSPRFLPLDHLGYRMVASGTSSLSMNTPKHLTFEPNPELKSRAASILAADPKTDYRIVLAELTKDASEAAPVVLHTLRVASLHKAGGAVIGRLVATSAFLPSKWGDRQLYFRHNRGCASKSLAQPAGACPARPM